VSQNGRSTQLLANVPRSEAGKRRPSSSSGGRVTVQNGTLGTLATTSRTPGKRSPTTKHQNEKRIRWDGGSLIKSPGFSEKFVFFCNLFLFHNIVLCCNLLLFYLLHVMDFVRLASFPVMSGPCCFCSCFWGTPRVESKVWGDCDPKPVWVHGMVSYSACLLTVARCRRAACRNSTSPERHLTGTAPHRNGTLPEDSGLVCAELHTAESRRVTAQEGLGNGYIRSKLLPLVDRRT